ncbi:hypothetical protein LBMAG53_33170 [Planctomycetota bacterium]|nr:hypothetical protein LBMAG53_33170 [Planctomycetota bacterium]
MWYSKVTGARLPPWNSGNGNPGEAITRRSGQTGAVDDMTIWGFPAFRSAADVATCSAATWRAMPVLPAR